MDRPRAPSDVDAAHEAWGANCGPVALAALLGLDVEQVHEAVSEIGLFGPEFRGYMNIPTMRRALERLQTRYRVLRSPTLPELLRNRTVACVQWSGPWNTVPRAAATYRHFVATSAGLVYDVNAGWIEASDWASSVAPVLIPSRGDGSWLYTWAAALI